MNLQRITVEINKLPSTRKNVSLYDGDSVARALAEAFGDDNYATYSITVNGSSAGLDTRLHEGDSIALAKQTKGNADEVEATEEVAPTDAVEAVVTEEVIAEVVEAPEAEVIEETQE